MGRVDSGEGFEVRGEATEEQADLTFEQLGLSAEVLLGLQDLGYETPTPVQAALVPLMKSGLDLIVQARTGTGKTAAFGLPIVDTLVPAAEGVRALVLTPTRELALQVATEVDALGRHRGTRVATVYGGVALQPQIRALARANVVVGTPGRLLDHLQRGTLQLGRVQICVLDESDEMLSMGFLEDVEAILQRLPEKRQFVLCSATIAPDILRLSERYMVAPEFVSLSSDQVAAEAVAHSYYMVLGTARLRDLVRVIELEQPESAIIFCNTRADTGMVASYLQGAGYDAVAISGDLPQREREIVLERMRKGGVRFLVATDVAARGIDISDLSHVINYALPDQLELYIHRTGRTGRAGASGRAISLISPQELGAFYFLRKTYPLEMVFRELPALDESSDPFSGVLERELQREARLAAEGPREPRPPREDERERRPRGDGRRGARRDDRRDDRSARPRRAEEGDRRGRPERGGDRPARPRHEGAAERREERPAAAAAPEISVPGEVEHGGEGERGEAERSRSRRRRRSSRSVPEGMVRLHMNVGRERMDEGKDEIRGLLTEIAELPAEAFGGIDVHRGFSFVNVAADRVERALELLNGKEHAGGVLRVAPAKSEEEKGQ